MENDFAQGQVLIALEELFDYIGFDLFLVTQSNHSPARSLLKSRSFAMHSFRLGSYIRAA